MTVSKRPETLKNKEKGTIGVAVVGTGGWSNTHFMACKANPNINLVGICDLKEESMQLVSQRHGLNVPRFTDYHDLLKMGNLDAVIISTSNDAHAPIAIAAAEAGKHILCQKPMARNLEEARAMTAAVKKAGVCNMVAYTKRFFAHTLFLHDYLQKEKLGRIYHIRAAYYQNWLLNPDAPRVWRLNRQMTGTGSLGDLGAHVIDLAQYLAGDDITRVSAIMKTFLAERPSLTDRQKKEVVDVDDAAAFTVEFKNGAIGVVQASRNATGHPDHWYVEIDAEKSAIILDKDASPHIKIRSGSRVATTGQTKDSGWEELSISKQVGENEHQNQVNHFIECIQSGKTPSPSFAEGLKTERVMDAVVRSSITGTAITLDA